MTASLDISGLESISIGTDGTGLKTNNAGSYRTTKYRDPDAGKEQARIYRKLYGYRSASNFGKYHYNVKEFQFFLK